MPGLAASAVSHRKAEIFLLPILQSLHDSSVKNPDTFTVKNIVWPALNFIHLECVFTTSVNSLTAIWFLFKIVYFTFQNIIITNLAFPSLSSSLMSKCMIKA